MQRAAERVWIRCQVGGREGVSRMRGKETQEREEMGIMRKEIEQGDG